MLHSLKRQLHLFVLFYLVFMFVLAKTMYLCRTLGELLRMHSGCFCYISNNVWFWKEQGLVSFAEMKCQKCRKIGAHNTPIPFFNAFNHLWICVWWSKLMRQRNPTACHSQKKSATRKDLTLSALGPSQVKEISSSESPRLKIYFDALIRGTADELLRENLWKMGTLFLNMAVNKGRTWVHRSPFRKICSMGFTNYCEIWGSPVFLGCKNGRMAPLVGLSENMFGKSVDGEHGYPGLKRELRNYTTIVIHIHMELYTTRIPTIWGLKLEDRCFKLEAPRGPMGSTSKNGMRGWHDGSERFVMDTARDALWVVDYLSMRPDVLQEPTFANEWWITMAWSIRHL